MSGWRRFLAVASFVLAVALLLPSWPAAAEEAPASPTPSIQPAPTEGVVSPTPTESATAAPEPTTTQAPTAEPTQAPPEPTQSPPEPTQIPPEPTQAPVAAPEPPAPAAPPPEAAPPAGPTAPTYRVFATREGLVGHRTANGHRIQPRDRFVALPSWNVLSSRGGSEFQVRVTYRGRSVVLPVWDVGPWNTRDDYWNPGRRYGDLPVGVPMAQVARQQGYNGGRDEFGRRVRQPNGIDIADGAFWDDLGMSDSDWVEVTFLWLGDDPGPGAEAQDVTAPTPLPEDNGPPEARVTEVAAHEQGLMVRWSGTDDGVGIAAYDVQVRWLPDGGWTDWQQATTSSEALFVPPGVGEFAFRAKARDWYGNEQAWRDQDDVIAKVGP